MFTFVVCSFCKLFTSMSRFLTRMRNLLMTVSPLFFVFACELKFQSAIQMIARIAHYGSICRTISVLNGKLSLVTMAIC